MGEGPQALMEPRPSAQCLGMGVAMSSAPEVGVPPPEWGQRWYLGLPRSGDPESGEWVLVIPLTTVSGREDHSADSVSTTRLLP